MGHRTTPLAPTKSLLLGVCLAAVTMMAAAPANAEWPHDPYTNVPLATTPGVWEYNHEAVSDGAGGAIVVWDKQSSEPTLFGVDFSDINNGVAVGVNGAIRTTTDGGVNWIDRSSGTSVALRGVSMVDASTAFVCGDNGTLLRTTDGGATWVSLTSGTVWNLRAISMLDASTGMAVGDSGAMLKTTDGGASWFSVSVTIEDLYGVVFIDANAVCVVGLASTILRSNNGGTSWISQSSGASEDLFAVDFIDASNGIAVGAYDLVTRTSDGGVNWSPDYPTFSGGDYYAVDMVSTTRALAAGDGVIWMTNGSTWNEIYPPSSTTYYGVALIDYPHATLVGSYGYILRTNDAFGSISVQSQGYDIYAQHVSASGDLLWGIDGLPVCRALGDQNYPEIAEDGSGGAFVMWRDPRNDPYSTQIYGQRVDANGFAQWAADGVLIIDQYATFTDHGVVSDGNGGAVMVFALTGDIYAQRVDGTGATWAPAGVPVCTAASTQTDAVVAPDMMGGVVVAWEDFRNGNWDVYAQRLNATGNTRWTPDGRAVTNLSHAEVEPRIVPSNPGSAMVVFKSDLGTASGGIVAQRMTEFGSQSFGGAGVPLRGLSSSATLFDAASDGDGGAIAVWGDLRGSSQDLYAQKVTGWGTTEWTTDGVVVCDVPNSQTAARIISDGAGGAVVAWSDDRAGCCSSTDQYAQRILLNGARMWTPTGRPICVANYYQQNPRLVSDGSGGAVIAWRDNRSETSGDIYCQRVEGAGNLGYPSPSISTVVDSPADQGGRAIVSWLPSYLDAYPGTLLTQYSIWRRLESAAAAQPAGATTAGLTPVSISGALSGAPASHSDPMTAAVASPTDPMIAVVASPSDPMTAGAEASREHALAAGIDPGLVAQMAAGGWAYIDAIDASYLQEYAYEAPTYGDSSGAGNPITGYQVIAHSTTQYVSWVSEPATGYSVDNLAPSSPLMLTGERPAQDVNLHWLPGTTHYEDLSHYAVYRSASAGFTPDPSNFVGTTTDTAYVDLDPGTSAFYYRVTAVDIHDNEGTPSNELTIPGTPTGANTPAMPAVFTLLSNHPNPFARTTSLRYGLPVQSTVTIDVYDVAGRRVFSDRVTRPAGWQTYQFSSRDLPSGVYFYRVTAAGRTETRKMVLTR